VRRRQRHPFLMEYERLEFSAGHRKSLATVAALEGRRERIEKS